MLQNAMKAMMRSGSITGGGRAAASRHCFPTVLRRGLKAQATPEQHGAQPEQQSKRGEQQEGSLAAPRRGGRQSGLAAGGGGIAPIPMRRMFDALNDMQREMNALMGSSAMLGGGPFDLLDSAVGGPMGGLLAAAPPADVVGLPFDVVETEKDYQIHADVPGFKPADVKVTLTPDRVLTVRGKQEEKEEAEGYMMRRRSNFVRRIQLPDGVDTDHIKAVTEHGALNITIPKSEAAKVKPKEIPVHGGRA